MPIGVRCRRSPGPAAPAGPAPPAGAGAAGAGRRQLARHRPDQALGRRTPLLGLGGGRRGGRAARRRSLTTAAGHAAQHTVRSPAWPTDCAARSASSRRRASPSIRTQNSHLIHRTPSLTGRLVTGRAAAGRRGGPGRRSGRWHEMPSAAASAANAAASASTRPRPSRARRPAPGHAQRHLAAGVAQLARGQQAQPGAAQEHVPDRAGLLVAGRERRLGQQVGQAGDDRLGQLAGPAASPARARRRSRSARRAAVGVLGHALHPGQRGRVDGRAQRDLLGAAGAWRPSRSTSRSTASLAIRRQVVSLPPVIVIRPLEVSYSSALREMSTDLRLSPLEISGRTPA